MGALKEPIFLLSKRKEQKKKKRKDQVIKMSYAISSILGVYQ